MKTLLRNGVLDPPPSIAAARQRVKQDDAEIERLQGQLDDVTQVKRFASMDAYDEWCRKVDRVRRLFVVERRLLKDWIADRSRDVEFLLREAHELFKALRADDVEFEPDEVDVMNRIAKFFDKDAAKKTAA